MDKRILDRLDKKLRDQFSIEMIYNSNAIECNKLTLKETYLILRWEVFKSTIDIL